MPEEDLEGFVFFNNDETYTSIDGAWITLATIAELSTVEPDQDLSIEIVKSDNRV
jgi:hypothetical protein